VADTVKPASLSLSPFHEPRLAPQIRHPGESRDLGRRRGEGAARDPGFRRDDEYWRGM